MNHPRSVGSSLVDPPPPETLKHVADKDPISEPQGLGLALPLTGLRVQVSNTCIWIGVTSNDSSSTGFGAVDDY